MSEVALHHTCSTKGQCRTLQCYKPNSVPSCVGRTCMAQLPACLLFEWHNTTTGSPPQKGNQVVLCDS
jgi:hypothetical protein